MSVGTLAVVTVFNVLLFYLKESEGFESKIDIFTTEIFRFKLLNTISLLRPKLALNSGFATSVCNLFPERAKFNFTAPCDVPQITRDRRSLI